jgi:hypothetical protein
MPCIYGWKRILCAKWVLSGIFSCPSEVIYTSVTPEVQGGFERGSADTVDLIRGSIGMLTTLQVGVVSCMSGLEPRAQNAI